MSFGERPILAGPPAGMDSSDRELLSAALELLDAVYVEGRHEVAAAMRSVDGVIHRGAHVEASAGRATVCAEGAALGAALVASADAAAPLKLEAIVSVLRRPGGTTHFIEPCGACSELLSDYAPGARVWVAIGDTVEPVTVSALLPAKHRRARWTTP